MSVVDILGWLDERVQRSADLCMDSRQMRVGDVFFACPGIAGDGRDFMQQAVAAGAAAIVREKGGQQISPAGIDVLEVPRLTEQLGELAHLWYGRPSDALTVIAITGTNGKTSITQWLAAAMNQEGMPCGTIGTLGVRLADGQHMSAILTTPDVLTMHRSLAAIVRSGGVAAAIEASSIGLAQGRLAGVRIQIAGFTNLTRDHLDYHGTLENYRQAKLALFRWPGLRAAIANLDDPAGELFLAQCQDQCRQLGFGLWADPPAAFRAEDVQHGPRGLVFNLLTPGGRAQILTRLVGEHNITNLLMVAGILRELGWGLSRTARALSQLAPVPGRLEIVSPLPGLGANRKLPLLVVDYAHTPDALQRVLEALRPVATERGGQLVCVFGCGGDRDAGKRPQMGAVAARLADCVRVTSDNPRSEDPQAIIEQIVAGMPQRPMIDVHRDQAILDAVWRAADNDVILFAGKGHETWQETRGRRQPFDDRHWARFALARRQGAELSTDSRHLLPGQIFLALKGDTFDGHNFLGAARQAGASAAIVAHPVPESSLPQFVLGDTLRALQSIATAWRRQIDIPVIAVVGSNGKTTTKEMISAILASWLGPDARVASPGNFNNEIGVPLSVLQLQPTHRAAVFELGMNHEGEIAVLAQIAQPRITVMTNAQREHQEFLASVSAVAHENGAAIAALPADGVAVIPGDDAHAPVWQKLAAGRRLLRFGFGERSDVWASQIHAGIEQTEFRLHLAEQAALVCLPVPGRHNLHNALAAAAATWAAGAPPGSIVQGLQSFEPVGGRMQMQKLPDGFLLIDDSYNANPDSVRAAIDVLADLDGRQLLVLGDMAEVGERGPAMHAEVGGYAHEKGIDHLLTFGTAARQAASSFGAGARACSSIDELLGAIRALRPAHILVKGSRSMRMERVVAALSAGPQRGLHAS